MKLLINGETQEVENADTIKTLLVKLSYQSEFIAVALNGTAIARADYASTPIKENDVIEVLSPMQGG